MRIAVFLDIHSLYTSTNKKYNKKLNYEKYLDFIKEIGDINIKLGYSIQMKQHCSSFISRLKDLGIDVICKDDSRGRVEWGCGLTVDVIRLLNDFDYCILGTSDSNYVPLIEYLRDQNKTVVVYSSLIPQALKKKASRYIEIFEDMCEGELDGSTN